ncbi:uncharacterized protein [Solanum lycopersicum]|uniref:uncharacterized protein n=1 Tax=Solanum lycopersicum TaxID=4081 RepID=UPI0037485B18
MTPFEELYGRKCRSLIWWIEVGESSILCPQIIHEALDKVKVTRNRLATGYSRHKSYADNRKMTLEFNIGDQVYLKISPIKGVMKLDKKGKWSPRYVGPYEILQRVGLGVDEVLFYEEVHVDIFVRQVKRLRKKEVSTLKVLWRNHLVEGST